MKKIMEISAVLLGLVMNCSAGNYFKTIDFSHPITSVGVINDFHGHYDGAGVVSIFYHQPDTTDMLAKLIDGWTPLTLGGSAGRGLGGPAILVGSGFNLLPLGQGLIKALISSLDSGNASQISLGNPAGDETPSAEIFIGPQEAWIFNSLTKSRLAATFFISTTIKF
jgi:hypothetical protein